MDDAPLIPSPLFGLRTWRVVADENGDRLTAAHRGTPWPAGGAWLSAECGVTPEHDAPAAGCLCGIHAWHPTARAAKRVLGARAEVPGIVEAGGTVELHEEGFRASRARPYALFAGPGRNAQAIARLGRRYGVPVVDVASPAALVEWCRERGLGLGPQVVEQLLGPQRALEARAQRRRARRRGILGVAAYVAVAAVVLVAGLLFFSGPPSPKGVYGRTGWVIPPRTTTTTKPSPPRRTTVVAPAPVIVHNARETTRAKRSRCRYGESDDRTRSRRRGRAHDRAAARRCRSR
jgi:hypothetical protein